MPKNISWHPEGEPITIELHEFSQFFKAQQKLLQEQIKQKREQEKLKAPARLAKPSRKKTSKKNRGKK